MNIELVSIAKKEKTIYDPLYKELEKMISRFAKLKDTEIFNKDVTKAQQFHQMLHKRHIVRF